MPDADRHLLDHANPHLTQQQRGWALENEALWRQAHDIAGQNPGLDVGDIYHSLRALRLSPSQRLRRGLERVRIRANEG